MDEDTDEVQTGAHNLQQIQRQIHELVDVLDSNAGEFQVITRRMKYKQVVRNNRWALSIGLVVLVVVLILAGVIISVVYNDRN
uniref:V-SNARE coiled-coil homology domain-containing protein n=1 Tax=Magallana gigas TaxID=29159 RepID=K1QCG6_MAGGI